MKRRVLGVKAVLCCVLLTTGCATSPVDFGQLEERDGFYHDRDSGHPFTGVAVREVDDGERIKTTYIQGRWCPSTDDEWDFYVGQALAKKKWKPEIQTISLPPIHIQSTLWYSNGDKSLIDDTWEPDDSR